MHISAAYPTAFFCKISKIERISSSLAIRGNESAPDVSLREKVYEICNLLFQQQKAVGITLRGIEERIRDLKEDFMTVVERKRPWASRENIEQMFTENKTLEV